MVIKTKGREIRVNQVEVSDMRGFVCLSCEGKSCSEAVLGLYDKLISLNRSKVEISVPSGSNTVVYNGLKFVYEDGRAWVNYRRWAKGLV